MAKCIPYRTAAVVPAQPDQRQHFTGTLPTPLSTNNNAFANVLTIGPSQVGLFWVDVRCVGQGPMEVQAVLQSTGEVVLLNGTGWIIVPGQWGGSGRIFLRGGGPIEFHFRSSLLGQMAHLDLLEVSGTFESGESLPSFTSVVTTKRKPVGRWETLTADQEELQFPED